MHIPCPATLLLTVLLFWPLLLRLRLRFLPCLRLLPPLPSLLHQLLDSTVVRPSRHGLAPRCTLLRSDTIRPSTFPQSPSFLDTRPSRYLAILLLLLRPRRPTTARPTACCRSLQVTVLLAALTLFRRDPHQPSLSNLHHLRLLICKFSSTTIFGSGACLSRHRPYPSCPPEPIFCDNLSPPHLIDDEILAQPPLASLPLSWHLTLVFQDAIFAVLKKVEASRRRTWPFTTRIPLRRFLAIFILPRPTQVSIEPAS